MKTALGFVALLTLLGAFIQSQQAAAQNLPGAFGLSISGSFVNGTAESWNSVLIADNDLTNGYKSGFDTIDTPAALNPAGPAGSAAFQWGSAASSSVSSSYLHPSALWFQPLNVGSAMPEQSFELGYLYYRNGTIKSNSGATGVDLAMTLSFVQPLGVDPISVVFGADLINSQNTTDLVESADIVSLSSLSAPINFTDDLGQSYFLELTFQVDDDTIDGTLSTSDQFRVFEGSMGRATLMGRITTCPIDGHGPPMVPEPSAALIGALGVFFLLRRRR